MAHTWAPSFGVEVEVQSAGTLQLVDQPAAAKAIAVCAEVAVDLSAHRSQGLTTELIHWADKIYVMEPLHAHRILELSPEPSHDKVVSMGAFVGKAEINDPIGSWTKRPFRIARDEISVGVKRILTELIANEP